MYVTRFLTRRSICYYVKEKGHPVSELDKKNYSINFTSQMTQDAVINAREHNLRLQRLALGKVQKAVFRNVGRDSKDALVLQYFVFSFTSYII